VQEQQEQKNLIKSFDLFEEKKTEDEIDIDSDQVVEEDNEKDVQQEQKNLIKSLDLFEEKKTEDDIDIDIDKVVVDDDNDDVHNHGHDHEDDIPQSLKIFVHEHEQQQHEVVESLIEKNDTLISPVWNEKDETKEHRRSWQRNGTNDKDDDNDNDEWMISLEAGGMETNRIVLFRNNEQLTNYLRYVQYYYCE